MLSLYGVTVVLYLTKILNGFSNYWSHLRATDSSLHATALCWKHPHSWQIFCLALIQMELLSDRLEKFVLADCFIILSSSVFVHCGQTRNWQQPENGGRYSLFRNRPSWLTIVRFDWLFICLVNYSATVCLQYVSVLNYQAVSAAAFFQSIQPFMELNFFRWMCKTDWR